MDRFQTHFNVLPDVDEWKSGLAEWHHPELISFISLRGHDKRSETGDLQEAGVLHEYPDGGCPRVTSPWLHPAHGKRRATSCRWVSMPISNSRRCKGASDRVRQLS